MVRRELVRDVSIVILCPQEAQEAMVVAAAYMVAAGVKGRVPQ
jgi:hypothetical protein